MAMVLTVVAVVVVVVFFAFRDTATPLDEESVAATLAQPVGSEPGDPGVYSYTTSGYEEIDALAGARHDYPETTFMTIADSECGPIVTWRALEERWVDWRHCGPDLAITASNSYHEWFGFPDLEEESCPEPRPISGPVGPVGDFVCPAPPTSTETYQVEIIGTETLTVAGESAMTTHLRRTSSLSAGSSGTAVVDVWRLEGTPLIVRMSVRRESTTATQVGEVNYVEEVSLHLDSLTPRG